MVTKTKMLGLMLATAAVLAWPMLVYADTADVKTTPATDSSHQDGDWHHGHHNHMMSKILNLTEDQEKQLKAIKQKQKEAMKSVFEQMKTNREAFEAEIVKATPDMAKVNDLQAQIKTIQSQMVDNHLNSLLDIKKVLTPEQFAGYMALEKEEGMKKHMMGHGKLGHKGGACKSDKHHDSDDQD